MMKAEEKIILGRYEFWNVENGKIASAISSNFNNVLIYNCGQCGCGGACSGEAAKFFQQH